MPIEGHDFAPAPKEGAFNHLGVSALTVSPSKAREILSMQALSMRERPVRWGIVVARFNGAVTDSLFKGAVSALNENAIAPQDIHAVTVPGVVEIPFAADQLVRSYPDIVGIIALGCVIRGETSHFDYVCRAVTDGVMHVMAEHKVPVGFGVLTVDTLEQANARSELTAGGHNVGKDAALAVVEQVLRGLCR